MKWIRLAQVWHRCGVCVSKEQYNEAVGFEFAVEVGVVHEGERGLMELCGDELRGMGGRRVGCGREEAWGGCLTTFVEQSQAGQM